MQAMGQHMDLGVAPGHELAVEPEGAVALVEGDDVGHGIPFALARHAGQGLVIVRG